MRCLRNFGADLRPALTPNLAPALLVAGLLLALVPSAAVADSDAPAELGQAQFCRVTYALCITAPCEKVPTKMADGSEGEPRYLCTCDVIRDQPDAPAWSMGPDSCADRAPKHENGKEVLVSTYSNLYNEDANHVTECGEAIDWAWCYGATCVVDPKDPTKAQCNCPGKHTVANVLGSCDSDLCGHPPYWSAAWPKADCYANCRFYEWMTSQGYEANKPATLCSGKPVCECPAAK